jgi:hypothetical protein
MLEIIRQFYFGEIFLHRDFPASGKTITRGALEQVAPVTALVLADAGTQSAQHHIAEISAAGFASS